MRDTSTRCIDSLLSACADGDAQVRDHVLQSLRGLAQRDVVGVLRQCEQWLTHRKPSTTAASHRYVVVRGVVLILQDHRSTVVDAVPADLRDALVACAFSEMTSNSNDLTSEWARESCVWMVELCGQFPKQGMTQLLGSITASALPHVYVIQAIANAAEEHPYRIVSFVKESLAKLLPILSLAKQDNQRMLFAQALASLSEAVIRCLQSAPQPATPRSRVASSVSVGEFADTMYSAIQFLMGDWSRSSELRVRLPVVHALGTMFALCASENRVQLTPKLLPLVLAGVKREKARDVHAAAQGLSAFLAFLGDDVAYALQSQMEPAILPQLMQSVALALGDKEWSTNSDVKRGYASLMLVGERIAEFYMDGLATYISKMLDAKSQIKDSALRAASLQILRHLISRPSLEARLRPYTDSIIATVKLAQSDGDWRVRQAVAACVVAMGNSSIKFFEATGGSDLLTYVVRCAAVTAAASNPLAEELRDAARNTLTLFSSGSGGKLDPSLWPFLLEHFNEHASSPELLTVLPTVCRCLVQIGSRVSQTEHYYVDFAVSVNVPKPHQIAAKFLVQAMQISHYSGEELHSILECMSTMAPLLDDPFAQGNPEDVQNPVANVWLSIIPELQNVLMCGDEASLAIGEWEELVSKLVTKTMTCKQSEQWVEDVTAAATQQLSGYVGHPTMFRSALVVIGIGVGRSSKKDFVQSTVDYIIDAANHENEHHRAGLGKAFGYVAALHPDLVSDRMGTLAKGPEKRSFFASRDKTKKEIVEASRSIAAYGLCYGGRRMAGNIFTSRLDAVIIPTISAIVNECKLLDVREAALDACTLLEVPLRKLAASKEGGFSFKGRDGWIDVLLKCVPLEPPGGSGGGQKTPPSRALLSLSLTALRALAALVNAVATPVLSPAVAEKCCAFALQCIVARWAPQDLESVGGEAKLQSLASSVVNAVFLNSKRIDLDSIVAPFSNQTVNERDAVRERAMVICVELFRCCADRCDAIIAEGGALVQPAVTVGPLLGRLIPRAMDSIVNIRRLAFDGIQSLVRVISVLLPEMVSKYSVDISGVTEVLANLADRSASMVRDGTASSEKEVAAITKGLCIQLVSVLPDPAQFSSLLDTLLAAGITDPQDDGASCSCVVLHGMIRGLGSTIAETDARRHLENLLESVPKVKSREQSLSGILVSIRNVAKHHSLMAFNTMLKQEAPHSEALVHAAQSVTNDSNLATLLTQHCLDLILNSQLTEERPDTKDKNRLVKDLAAVPLSCICMLGWICGTPKGAEAIINHRADVYGALILYLTAAHEFGDLGKVAHVAKALQLVVENTSGEVTSDRMERYGWQRLQDPKQFPKASMELIKYWCREELGDSTEETDRGLVLDPVNGLPLPPSEPTALTVELAQFLLPYANKPIKSHRRASIHAASSLLHCSLGDKKLLQSLSTTLLGRSGSDEDVVLRAEALRAFPNLVVHEYRHAQVYVSPMLSALISNFSDANLAVSTAAMKATIELMIRIPEKEQIAPIAVNIALKAKPLFESKEREQRKLAYDVLKGLVVLGTEGHMDEQMMDQQVYLHLATLLVHCEDDDEDVKRSVKETLRASAQWIAAHTTAEGSVAITGVFSKPFVQPQAKMNYDDFVNDFCFVWVAHFAGHVNDLLVATMGFFTHDRESLRSAAVMLAGNILRHIPPADMGRAHVDQLCNALISILNPSKERSATVRSKAARALGQLREL